MKIDNEVLNRLNLSEADIVLLNDLIDISGYKDDLIIEKILLILLSGKNDGSSCVDINSEYFNNKLKIFNDVNIDDIKKVLTDDKYNNLITKNAKEFKPVFLINNNDKIFLYFQKYYKNENILKKRFEHLLNNNEAFNIDKKSLKIIFDSIYKNNDFGIDLTDYQKTAIIMSLINNFTIITGGPGSGKTTCINVIINILFKLGFLASDIALTSFTGKAANRLEESLIENNLDDSEFLNKIESINISTIHRLLKYNPNTNSFKFNENNKLFFKIIIIDEASMIDLVLMTNLLKAVNDNVRLILIGDKDQLPSIEVGGVLSSVIPDISEPFFSNDIIKILKDYFKISLDFKIGYTLLTDRVIKLEGNNRTHNESIKTLSKLINLQSDDLFKFLNKTDVHDKINFFDNNSTAIQIVPTKNVKNDIDRLLSLWIENYYYKLKTDSKSFFDYVEIVKKYDFNKDEEKLNGIIFIIFDFIQKAKILTVIKEGYAGHTYINNYINQYLNNKEKYNDLNSLIAGTPVIINVNDYINDLFNGDIGVILEDKNGLKKIFFKRTIYYKSFLIEQMRNFEISYAMTVHKSQGSGYANIFLIFPDDENNKLLTKEILYTGITRAKNNIVLYADDNIILKILSRKTERQSGFGFY